jgi:hypothetical protein
MDAGTTCELNGARPVGVGQPAFLLAAATGRERDPPPVRGKAGIEVRERGLQQRRCRAIGIPAIDVDVVSADLVGEAVSRKDRRWTAGIPSSELDCVSYPRGDGHSVELRDE